MPCSPRRQDVVSHVQRSALLFIAAALLVPLSACGLQPKPGPSTPSGQTRSAFETPFYPDELVIHPLTRIIEDRDTGAIAIDAHVELRDRWGDGVKALGTLTFELYGSTGVGRRAQLLRWNVDLTDPDANSEPFDRVTQTYRILLQGLTQRQQAGQVLTLQAQFTTLDGRQLQGTHRLAR